MRMTGEDLKKKGGGEFNLRNADLQKWFDLHRSDFHKNVPSLQK
jgi:hypothetical protein